MILIPVFSLILIAYHYWVPYCEGIAFEGCGDGVTHGGCQTISADGGIGSQSVNSILLKNDFIDFGRYYGCPYDVNSCPTGFSYYGFVKFRSYPENCSSFGVVASTNQFNVHILGTGRLAVYVWMADNQEWYAETMQPVILDAYYPLIWQFTYSQTSKMGELKVIMQSQLSAFQNCSRPRTYTPPHPNLIFGGDGVSGNFANIQLDRTNFDIYNSPIETLVGILLDVNTRRANCVGKSYATLTRDLTCYWLETSPLSWADAYAKCSSSAYDAGYPYGRLARFPTDNATIWDVVSPKLSLAGRGAGGYEAWLGGGNMGQWKTRSLASVSPLKVPNGVQYTKPTSADGQCLLMNTTTPNVTWNEQNCSLAKRFVCSMSWDCALVNPCKNLGACVPVNDGVTCICFGRTSGPYCETGRIMPSCVNNCPCKLPPLYQCGPTTTTRTTTAASTVKTQNRLVTYPPHPPLSEDYEEKKRFVVINVKKCEILQDKYAQAQEGLLIQMEKEMKAKNLQMGNFKWRKNAEESLNLFSKEKREELKSSFDKNQKDLALETWESHMKSRLSEVTVLQYENMFAKKEYSFSKNINQRKDKCRQMKKNLKGKCFLRQTSGSKRITKTYSQFFHNLSTLCPSASTTTSKGQSQGSAETSGSSSAAAASAARSDSSYSSSASNSQASSSKSSLRSRSSSSSDQLISSLSGGSAAAASSGSSASSLGSANSLLTSLEGGKILSAMEPSKQSPIASVANSAVASKSASSSSSSSFVDAKNLAGSIMSSAGVPENRKPMINLPVRRNIMSKSSVHSHILKK